MSFKLHNAKAFKADFAYLIGTQATFNEGKEKRLVKGIVIVGDDGACIQEQMKPHALQQALEDDSFLIRKPWNFTYRVYLIHQPEGASTLYYRELAEMLDELKIPFIAGKYQG